MSKPNTSYEPIDRLTRICDAMISVFEGHDEHRDSDKCIVFLDDGDMGGIVIHGYDDMVEAVTDLLLHLKAMFQSTGRDLDIVFLGSEGIDRA